jgi:hypothetical protein
MDRSVQLLLEQLSAAVVGLAGRRSSGRDPAGETARPSASIPVLSGGSVEAAYVSGVLAGLRVAGALTEAEYDDWQLRMTTAVDSARADAGRELVEAEPSRVLRPSAPAVPHGDVTIRMDSIGFSSSGVRIDWVVDLSDKKIQEDLREPARLRARGELSDRRLHLLALSFCARLGSVAMSDDSGRAYECVRTQAQFAPDWSAMRVATWFAPNVDDRARQLRVLWGSAELSCDLP